MKVIKEGGHRLFEEDQETTRCVRKMLDDLRKNGMDAVRKYSQKFDDWNPDSFELTQQQIGEAIAKCDQQLVQDTDFCQRNVRAFAEAQLATIQPLEVEISPGIVLGHKHIPISRVGSYVPGGRYPMFGSAQKLRFPVYRGRDDGCLWRQIDRHQSHLADQPFGTVHRGCLGGQIFKNSDLPKNDP